MTHLPDPIELLEQILENQERIEGKLDDLLSDKAIEVPFPVMPDLPPVPDILGSPNTCSLCGMSFSGITGYVCQDPRCPMGLGPISC